MSIEGDFEIIKSHWRDLYPWRRELTMDDIINTLRQSVLYVYNRFSVGMSMIDAIRILKEIVQTFPDSIINLEILHHPDRIRYFYNMHGRIVPGWFYAQYGMYLSDDEIVHIPCPLSP